MPAAEVIEPSAIRLWAQRLAAEMDNLIIELYAS